MKLVVGIAAKTEMKAPCCSAGLFGFNEACSGYYDCWAQKREQEVGTVFFSVSLKMFY
jgi:hypothetical protein